MNLYIAEVFKVKKYDDADIGDNELYYELISQPRVLVYKHNNLYINIKTKEVYKPDNNDIKEGDIVLFPDQLISLQDFLKQNNIEIEENISERKINKLFSGKGNFKNLFVCDLKVTELFEQTEFGVSVYVQPFGSALVHQRKNGNYYNIFSGEKYRDSSSITDLKQVYIDSKKELYDVIDEEFILRKII